MTQRNILSLDVFAFVRFLMRFLLRLLVMVVFVQSSQAAEKYGPFYWQQESPTYVILHGEIELNSYTSFQRLLTEHPEVKYMMLLSPGGYVIEGLKIADEVHKRRIVTWVPKNGECSSACSFIFFAGVERKLEGNLGVHQLSGVNNIQYAQLNVADILAQLNSYGVDPRIFPIMLKTLPNQLYYFSDTEKVLYHLDTLSTNNHHQDISKATKETQVKNFVISLVLYSGTPSTERLRSLYSNVVDYYGKKVTSDFVINDKKRFFHNWPQRENIVDMKTAKASCDEYDICTVIGEFSWNVYNPERQRALKGRSSFLYKIHLKDRFFIVAEINKKL